MLAGVVLLLAFAAPPGLLRQPLGDAELTSPKGEVRRLTTLAGGNAHALVLLPAEITADACAAVSREAKRVLQFGLALTLVRSRSGGCGDSLFWTPTASTERRLAPGQAIVIDAEGVVRFAQALGTATFAQLIAWEQGRQSFAVHCGHCHGDDGAATGIKTLTGITTRLSDAKVIEGAEQFGAVPMSTWPQAEIESLMLFVRGL